MKNILVKVPTVLVLVLFFLIISFVASDTKKTGAQYIPEGIEEQISFDLNPTIPGPNQTVTIKATSYSTDLNKATITWRVDGVLELRDVGARNFTFDTGNLGSVTRVSVTIEKSGGGVVERSFTFRPAEVDLIYEAETTVPPLYRGKALYSDQSFVRIIAVPQFTNSAGTKIAPENLTYTWSVDGKVIPSESGYGKYLLYYKGQLISRPVQISVVVSPTNSDQSAKGSLVLNPQDGQVFVYEKNPIYGTIFEQSIRGDFVLDREEIEFEAFPYYFSRDSFNQNLEFKWKMNGQTINVPTSQKNLVFRNQNNEDGEARVELGVTNKDTFQQVAKASFNLFFGDTSLVDFSF